MIEYDEEEASDAVDLKHEGGAKILQMLHGMSVEEQAAFWQQRTRELRKLQQELRRKPGDNKRKK